MNQAKRYKVLISAYACEPGKGSEPEVGWQWVVHLAKYCDVTVLTRSNNRQAIDDKLSKIAGNKPHFIYIDLGTLSRNVKQWIKPRFAAVSWYYSSWQTKAFFEIKELQKRNHYDLIHHLTFASFRLPFAVSGHGAPCVVGPVGGCEEFPEELLPIRGRKVVAKEVFRNLMTRLITGLGLGMHRYHCVDQVIASTLEMQQVFAEHNIESHLVSQIGVTGDNTAAMVKQKKANDGRIKLLFVGGIVYWKGLELAVHVLSDLPPTVSLTIIGSGPDEGLLRKEVERLLLTDRVHFMGRKKHNEVIKLYENYDLFLYPSLHDSGSFTVLEAMAAGLPVVCLDRGGPALSVDNECGKVIKAKSRHETINSLRSAVKYYLNNPAQLAVHGDCARRKLLDAYDWEKKAQTMATIYDDVITGR